MSIDLKFSDRQMRELERLFAAIPANARKAAAGAINKTLSKAKTRIKRRIAGDIGVPVGKVAKRIAVIRAKVADLVGILRLKFNRIALIASSQTPAKGQSYALTQDGEEQPLVNTPFRQTMLSGHQGWIVRDGPKRVMAKGRYKGRRRQPIKQIYTDSPASNWERSGSIAAEELDAAGEDLEKQLLSQIDRFLK